MKTHVFPVTHTPLYTHAKNQVSVTCSCGWIGVKVPSVEASREQFAMHQEQAYLYERSPKLEPVPWS